MNCKNCKAEITESMEYCQNCGNVIKKDDNENNNMFLNQMDQQGQSDSQSRQVFGNPINYNHPPQKSNANMYLILTIIGVIVVIVIGFFVANGIFISNNSNTNNFETNPSHIVKLDGLTFTFPVDFYYEKSDDVLMIGDKEETWISYFEVIDDNYDEYEKDSSLLVNLMKENYEIVSNSKQISVGGLDYITVEISQNNQNAIVAITKANPNSIIGVTFLAKSNEYDYSLLEKLTPIINSAIGAN